MSIRIAPSGTLKAKPKCTPSFARTAFLSSTLTMSTRSRPSMTRISRLKLDAARARRTRPAATPPAGRLLDGDLRRAGLLGLLHAIARTRSSSVQADARLRVAQFGVDGRAPQAGDGAGGRIDLHRNRRVLTASSLRPSPCRALRLLPARDRVALGRPARARPWPGRPVRRSKAAARGPSCRRSR